MNEKVVAITGASSGIGAASALLLAGRGAKVVLGARRTEHLAMTRRDQIAIPPDAIARAIAFAIEEPLDVDVNEIVVRPTAQA
jgi:NADP-dependent 3-hydroxy acid dehydrogenase YdfG